MEIFKRLHELEDEFIKESVGDFVPTKKTGKWVVSDNGDMEYDDYYFISHKRLKEKDWVLHVLEKQWSVRDFLTAYFQALRQIGEKEITIKTTY